MCISFVSPVWRGCWLRPRTAHSWNYTCVFYLWAIYICVIYICAINICVFHSWAQWDEGVDFAHEPLVRDIHMYISFVGYIHMCHVHMCHIHICISFVGPHAYVYVVNYICVCPSWAQCNEVLMRAIYVCVLFICVIYTNVYFIREPIYICVLRHIHIYVYFIHEPNVRRC